MTTLDDMSDHCYFNASNGRSGSMSSTTSLNGGGTNNIVSASLVPPPAHSPPKQPIVVISSSKPFLPARPGDNTQGQCRVGVLPTPPPAHGNSLKRTNFDVATLAISSSPPARQVVTSPNVGGASTRPYPSSVNSKHHGSAVISHVSQSSKLTASSLNSVPAHPATKYLQQPPTLGGGSGRPSGGSSTGTTANHHHHQRKSVPVSSISNSLPTPFEIFTTALGLPTTAALQFLGVSGTSPTKSQSTSSWHHTPPNGPVHRHPPNVNNSKLSTSGRKVRTNIDDVYQYFDASSSSLTPIASSHGLPSKKKRGPKPKIKTDGASEPKPKKTTVRKSEGYHHSSTKDGKQSKKRQRIDTPTVPSDEDFSDIDDEDDGDDVDSGIISLTLPVSTKLFFNFGWRPLRRKPDNPFMSDQSFANNTSKASTISSAKQRSVSKSSKKGRSSKGRNS